LEFEERNKKKETKEIALIEYLGKVKNPSDEKIDDAPEMATI